MAETLEEKISRIETSMSQLDRLEFKIDALMEDPYHAVNKYHSNLLLMETMIKAIERGESNGGNG